MFDQPMNLSLTECGVATNKKETYLKDVNVWLGLQLSQIICLNFCYCYLLKKEEKTHGETKRRSINDKKPSKMSQWTCLFVLIRLYSKLSISDVLLGIYKHHFLVIG